VADLPHSIPKPGKIGGTFLWAGIINGPVSSRRLGISLGLNILPPRSKLCTMDCPYCECGFNTPKAEGARWPSPDIVADALSKTLDALDVPPDWITLAGNGEPTMHPRFPAVVERVLTVRDARAPAAKVGILCNGLAAGKAGIAEALDRLDARMMKLDPGPPERVNGVAYDRELLVRNYAGLRDLTIQAMVVEGPGWSGASEEAVEEWLGYLRRIQPSAVQVYSLDRQPADLAITRVARERLMEIAARARGAIRGRVEVF
jgi:wyosine [tRNA(Phe)-imidazoG37] synthetase (radical SAM superfamily)